MPEDETWKQFGPALEAKRDELGLSKAEAARLAGVVPTTWTNVERGYSVNKGRHDPYPPTRDFVVKAVNKALKNWDLAEALTLAGLKPERLPVDDMERGPADMLRVWNKLSKQQQRALKWTMQLMLERHAALVDEPVPARDRVTPVFVAADSDQEQAHRR